ncbi:peritrophin-1-like isoform X2 [Malaya genurostris]|uniref:peritrophin-1-like isoform X2 n=1 Tax=Malaya genurostris TaxID=325434 RepID=UPI0026F3DE17|nr:peritrophin-1-like isoform X2 [Malaya genurostris]
MRGFLLVLVLTVVGVCAFPEYYPQNYYQPQPHQWEQPQWQKPQWEQPQWEQPQLQNPQWQQPQSQHPQMSPDGYRIVPGVDDSRCPRTDDAMNPVHLPVRGDCSKFMKCYGGRAYEQNCPAGLEFGTSVNRCDYPSLARCSMGW